jgi:hypothetical protein
MNQQFQRDKHAPVLVHFSLIIPVNVVILQYAVRANLLAIRSFGERALSNQEIPGKIPCQFSRGTRIPINPPQKPIRRALKYACLAA